LDLQKLFTEKTCKAKETRVGKFLTKTVAKLGGPYVLSSLHIICTTALGFFITYPIYLAGGFWAAFPTAVLTMIIVFIMAMVLIISKYGSIKWNPALRILLILAILGSLPFGLLSLPMVQKLSQECN